LGLCYLEGTGITQDEKEGVRWLKTAAENGNMDAVFNLGVYFFQKGDENTGTEWLRIAAEQGHEKATEFLKEIGG
jgi:TPR repeat protein